MSVAEYLENDLSEPLMAKYNEEKESQPFMLSKDDIKVLFNKGDSADDKDE